MEPVGVNDTSAAIQIVSKDGTNLQIVPMDMYQPPEFHRQCRSCIREYEEHMRFQNW
jgi:hypothetical protein